MATRAFHEIMSTRFWDFYPESLHSYRNVVLDNLASHRPFRKDEERDDRPYILSSKSGFTEKTYIGNPNWINYDRLDPEDTVIAVIDVQGPILRNGDACSYGSKEHKDIIMRAADDDHTIGFIIEMDSPGGSSSSKYDYQMALEYARSKGKKIVGHIDGMACSAGYALMALCDEIYFTNPHDIVGCIGTMCAMYTLKDGDVNAITNERYAEIYAEGSPYKNKEYRDAASGNYDALQADLNKLCNDFQQMVRDRRPKIKEDQLTGHTYEAGEVMGTMVDGQGTFEFCVNRIQELAGQKRNTSQSSSSRKDTSASTEAQETKQPETLNSGEDKPVKDNSTQTNEQTTMAKNYPFIMSAAGVNALVVDENNGFYSSETMNDNMEAFCKQATLDQSTLKSKLTEIDQLNQTINQMRTEHQKELDLLKQEHEKAMSSLKDSYQKEMDAKDDELKKTRKESEDKDAQIAELSELTGAHEEQNPPKNNGLDGGGQGFKVESVSNKKGSWESRYEAWKERERELEERR